MDPQPEKTCTKCKVEKPLEEFSADHQHRDGKRSHCKECIRKYRAANPEKAREYRRRHPEKYRKRVRLGRHLKCRYGLSLEQRNKLLTRQGGKCAVCGKKFDDKRKPHVDHCHDAGHVRGLLCINCNLAEGYFQRDPRNVRRLLAYMERNEIFYVNGLEVMQGSCLTSAERRKRSRTHVPLDLLP